MTRAHSVFPRVRSRRLRSGAAIRSMVREARLAPEDLIQPLFVMEGDGKDVPIPSMPGQGRISVRRLVEESQRAWELGIPAIALFPKIPDDQKSLDGAGAWDPEGLVPRAVRAVKEAVPELLVITDVALDPYSSLGQDGVVVDGEIHNDLTLLALAKQAACQAEAGADVVAPSDMMDGRVGFLRDHLDELGCERTMILAYSAKYASCYYGPFRDALDSAPRGGTDKRTYQMDPANSDEALHEVAQDLAEGADIVMVKPGMPYLDIVWRVKERFGRPVAVYQVSGEYAMLKAAGANGWLDEKAAVLESLVAFRRAGADAVLTYFAIEAAEWLRG